MSIRCQAITVFLFACVALTPLAQAVSPAPDGGYPGSNTAEGINALHDVNTAVGINNTAVGASALAHDTTGYSNVAVGAFALTNNTTGNFNMAIGTEALRDNNANFNLAIGFRVGYLNTTGNHLTGIGAAALRNNTTGSENTAIGADALHDNTVGEDNTAIGAEALFHNIGNTQNAEGHENTAVGASALHDNTAGFDNTASGALALDSNTIGANNTANGANALQNNTTGANNTASGALALNSNTTGGENTANGVVALNHNISGDGNTVDGFDALSNNTTGSYNTALGHDAGANLTTGDNNIDIGYSVLGVADESNTIRIGNTNITRTFIRGISGNIAAGGAAVYVESNGHLGTLTSSARFKDEVKPMGNASEALLALKPVTFRYKSEIDPAGTPQFGLVSEEVDKLNPNLVVRDKEGKPYSVRYEQINAMLLNEFLKEHKTVQELKSTVQKQEAIMAREQRSFQSKLAEQEKQIEALTLGLEKVSAKLEVSDRRSRTVFNNPQSDW
jgi:hypothetical protein